MGLAMTITKTQEAKVAEAKEEGLSFYSAHMNVGGTVSFVAHSWEDGGFSINDAGEPVCDVRGNTVASSKVEELDPANAQHVAQVEEWWG